MTENHGALRVATSSLLGLVLFLSMFVVSYAVPSTARWPEAPGTNMESAGTLTVDAINASHGYVMVHGAGNGDHLKLRVSKDGYQLMYDLNGEGVYETFPLQLGSGKYSFELFKNVSGSKYAQEGSVSISADMEMADEAFLYPNQYVNYTEDSRAVQISEEICAGLTTDAEKMEAVREYIVSNYEYDFNKAATIGAGVLPSIDYLLDNGMGICQDIAATAACMLRVQGIPTQLVIGYANRQYHAWNSVLIDGEYKHMDLTLEIGGIEGGATYTIERFY